jgi:hypothetical protein
MDVPADGDRPAFVDADSVRRRAFGATKQDVSLGHAAVDQVCTDLINGPLNHLPSSAFEANVAWPQSAATAQASNRAVDTLPSARHPVARGATLRVELIQVAGRSPASVDGPGLSAVGRVPADSQSRLAHSRRHLVNQRSQVCEKSS